LNYVYLIENNIYIDSVKVNPKGEFIFNQVLNGSYQIIYRTFFGLHRECVKIEDHNILIGEICFDQLPEMTYNEKTLIDSLSVGDTVLIRANISSTEFNCYEENAIIFRDCSKYYVEIISHKDNHGAVLASKQSLLIGKVYELNESQTKRLKSFFIELKYLSIEDIYSNAQDEYVILCNGKERSMTDFSGIWDGYNRMKYDIYQLSNK
jgi:hypothetical protein